MNTNLILEREGMCCINHYMLSVELQHTTVTLLCCVVSLGKYTSVCKVSKGNTFKTLNCQSPKFIIGILSIERGKSAVVC